MTAALLKIISTVTLFRPSGSGKGKGTERGFLRERNFIMKFEIFPEKGPGSDPVSFPFRGPIPNMKNQSESMA